MMEFSAQPEIICCELISTTPVLDTPTSLRAQDEPSWVRSCVLLVPDVITMDTVRALVGELAAKLSRKLMSCGITQKTTG